MLELDYTKELKKHRNKPVFTLAILNGCSQVEEFISTIDGVMLELEKMLKLKDIPQGAMHWSQPYPEFNLL